MPLDIVAFRRGLREHIGLEGDDTQTLPDTDTSEITGADTYLNRSYWEILDKFHFREKEVIGTFPTTQGENYYEVPSPFEALQHLSIEDLNDQSHSPLDLITKDTFEQNFVNNADAEGKPEKYFREDTGIRMWPTPDAVYVITIRYWETLANLSNSNTTSPIPQSWHEIILMGAVWRALLGLNNDKAGAQAIRAWQASLIEKNDPTKNKELEDTRRAGVEVLGYEDSDI